jgi:N-acetylglucosamine kinase-like BadF-type ATPase
MKMGYLRRNNKMYIGGIDAGGSKTECIIFDKNKEKIVARSRTGPANFQVVGLDKAVSEIKRALELALDFAGLTTLPLVGLGVAGAGRKEDINKLRLRINRLSFLNECFITNDGETALLGATGGGAGIILIAGTGSIAYGLRQDGDFIRSGGWGPILGDEGSGFWLGMKVLKSVIKASEGRGIKTPLVDIVKNELGIEKLSKLIPFIHQGNLPRKKIAGLVPLLLDVAEKGNRVASQIVAQGIEELLILVDSISLRLDYKPQEVAVCGGLFNNNFFSHTFKKKLEGKHSLLSYKPKYSAEYGAIFYALQQQERNE